jgi:hypothetical protein
MITVDNSYDAVAEHAKAAHKRDVIGVVLAVVVAFTIGAMRFSSDKVAKAPMAKQCVVGTSC